VGSHESVSPDDLRADLRHFADLIARLDRDGRLLEAAPHLLKVLGDLRAKIFAYEVRFTRNLAPPDNTGENAQTDMSKKVIEEAVEREREAEQEWRRPPDFGPGPL